jgi:BioD-like phosphotransacetylase family protein
MVMSVVSRVRRLVKHTRFFSSKDILRNPSLRNPAMADSLLVCNVSASQGTSPIVLSLLDFFQRAGYHRVGYFVPIARPKCADDDDPSCSISARVDLVRAAYSLDDEPSTMIGVLKEKALDMIANGERDALGELIFQRYSQYRRAYSGS